MHRLQMFPNLALNPMERSETMSMILTLFYSELTANIEKKAGSDLYSYAVSAQQESIWQPNRNLLPS